MENQVHGLWVEGELNLLAKLTVASFIRHNGQFTLWTYRPPSNLPSDVEVRDAREIIPENRVFQYQEGIQQGSVAGFSDIFRSRLLYQRGGWWTDMDVTLLQPIPDRFQDMPIVLRKHWETPIVGNLMKFPQRHPAMKSVYRQSTNEIDGTSLVWSRPIEILAEVCQKNQLIDDFSRTIGHHDEFCDVLPFIRLDIESPKSWWAFHWCNEMWRRNHFRIPRMISSETYLGKLIRTYDVA